MRLQDNSGSIMKKEQLSPRRRPVQKRSIDKMNKILDVSRRLIIDEGMEQLSTIRIAGDAGLPVGSVYSYFPNNIAIIHELAARWLAGLRRQFDEVCERDLQEVDWRLVIEELLHIVYGDQDDQDQRRFVVEMNKALNFFPELQDIRGEHAESVAATLADMLQQAGSQWSRERVLRFTRFCYELIGGLDNYLGLPDVEPAEAIDWTNQALQSVIAAALKE